MKWFTRRLSLLMAMSACGVLAGQSQAYAGPTNLTITSVINMPYSEFTALKSEFDTLKIEFAALKASSDTHFNNLSNPHQVSKTQVALGNVDNVQQIPMAEKGANGGVAALDNNGKIAGAMLADSYSLVSHNHDGSYVQKVGNSALVLGDFYKKSGGNCFNIPSGWQIGVCP